MKPDPIAPARGILVGLAISAGIWIVLGVVVVAAWWVLWPASSSGTLEAVGRAVGEASRR